jgi:hypothetical protein
LILLAGAIESYSRWCDTLWTRLLLAAGALCMLSPDMWATAIGVLMAAVAIAVTKLRARVATAGAS